MTVGSWQGGFPFLPLPFGGHGPLAGVVFLGPFALGQGAVIETCFYLSIKKHKLSKYLVLQEQALKLLF